MSEVVRGGWAKYVCQVVVLVDEATDQAIDAEVERRRVEGYPRGECGRSAVARTWIELGRKEDSEQQKPPDSGVMSPGVSGG